MTIVIKNGVGNGNLAKVDESNRLHTHAFTIDTDTSACIQGDAFDICSGIVTLTNANEHAILYIKNNEDDDLIISLQFVNLGTSTGGVGKSTVTTYLNPTGGTLISDANNAGVLNRRVGDSTSLTADSFGASAQGKTLTGGDTISFPSSGFAANSPFVLPQGQSLAMSVTPPTSNTSMRVGIGFYIVRNGSQHGND